MTDLTLALDVMGGDHGPHVTVPAVLQALTLHPDLSVILVGDQSKIDVHLRSAKKTTLSRIDIVDTKEVVLMSDKPVYALRHRKQSSMRLMFDLVKCGRAQGCLSAGNTGALVAMATVLLKTLPGIDRPALVSCLPTLTRKPTYLLDLGANISCDPKSLVQFAVMGSMLCEAVDNTSFPKIALLNVGTEEIKGNEQVKKAGNCLKKLPKINYIGFIEGDDIYKGNVDVIVCDGFVGNITLKTSEGIAKLILHQLKLGLRKGILLRFLAKLLVPQLQALLRQMNPDHYNGASLLGLTSIVVKSHGNADESAYLQSINLAVTEAKRRLPEMITDRLESILLDKSS